jgi:hypothetical protein
MKHVIVIPERYALGDVIAFKARRVPSIECDRLTVCCNESWQFLFPTASDFVDVKDQLNGTEEKHITELLKQIYPNAEFVKVDHRYKEIFDFDVEVPNRLSEETDLLVAPRKKPFGRAPHRDWDYWPLLTDKLKETGLNIKAIGRADMSYDCGVPLIEDLSDIASHMLKTRFVIATDSAFAHLALLLKVPVIVLWGERAGILPGQVYEQSYHSHMETFKRGFIYHLEGAWEDPYLALDEILKCLKS